VESQPESPEAVHALPADQYTLHLMIIKSADHNGAKLEYHSLIYNS
jgi:hypothetical protein